MQHESRNYMEQLNHNKKSVETQLKVLDAQLSNEKNTDKWLQLFQEKTRIQHKLKAIKSRIENYRKPLASGIESAELILTNIKH